MDWKEEVKMTEKKVRKGIKQHYVFNIITKEEK